MIIPGSFLPHIDVIDTTSVVDLDLLLQIILFDAKALFKLIKMVSFYRRKNASDLSKVRLSAPVASSDGNFQRRPEDNSSG